MGIPGDIRKKYPYLDNETILMGYRGSIAHGMYLPKEDPHSIDDKDVMAVIVPPIEYYFGLREWGSKGTREIFHNEWDIVSYELRKMLRLLAKGNPNVLSLLWLPDNLYIKRTEWGDMMIDNRSLFATRSVYHSFSGYAHGQLHRMTHYKFEGYMGQKRKALVDKYGYDCKNAAHLIRLLRMGIEFLNEGTLYVTRQDAQQLLDIKKGEWTLEKVKEESDRLFRRAEEAYDHSKLPDKPDMEKVNRLSVDILRRAHETIPPTLEK